MIGIRNLRNRVVVLEESNEALKKKSGSSKSKLSDEKENQLMKSNNAKEHYDFKDQKKCKSYQFTLRSMKNWPLTSIVNGKGNNENMCDKILTVPQGNENRYKQSSKSKTTKQNCSMKFKSRCPLKEKNSKETVGSTGIKKKAPVILSVNKQKQNVKKVAALNQKDIKSKEYKETINKIQSKNKLVNNKSKKYVVRKGATRTEMSIIKPATNIPVWKKYLNVNKSNQGKKRQSNVDVYDIALDEDLMSSEVEVKKKKICCRKNNVNSGGNKRKCLSVSTKSLKSKNKILSSNNYYSSKPDDKKTTLETDQIRSNVVNAKVATVETEKLTVLPSNGNTNNNVTCILVDKISRQTFPTTSVEDDPVEIIEQTVLDLQSSEPNLQRKNYVSILADELEKSFLMSKMTSFLMPKMTSTPDAVHLKDGIQTQKDGVVKVIDISNITTLNRNCLNTTVSTPDPPFNDNVVKETKNGIGDITLFESPTKEKKDKKGNQLKSPKKTIQINLFGEIVNSPSSIDSLEDSVLMPQKAYHTPDNFKTHLIRTKKVHENMRKEPQKSKQDMFIEKLVQHFDEIDDTELCVE